MKGRAAILKAHAQPVAIEEFDVPDPAPGCMVLKITQAGVCGSDMHLWRGDMTYPLPPQGSHMGHEGAGVVYKLGKGVTADSLGAPLHEGDRIVHAAIDPCGRCHLCLEGRINLCLYKHGNRSKVGEFPYFQGTFADYYYIHANKSVFKVPDEVHDELLGPVNCAYGTVLQGLTVAQAGHGQSIVFQGAGGLGLIGTALAKDMGADQIIVLDRLENRLELAEELGATHTINIDEYNTPEMRVGRVREITGGRGADLAVEVVGMAELLPEGLAMITNGGTYLDIGLFFSGRTVEFDPSSFVLSGKKLMGTAMYEPLVLPQVLDFLARNQDRVPLHKLVSHRFPLDAVNDALNQSEWVTGPTPVTRAVIEP